MTGIVKRVISDKMFGFIIGDDGTEYFFHKSALVREWSFDEVRAGGRVQFDQEEGEKGPRAANVERA